MDAPAAIAALEEKFAVRSKTEFRGETTLVVTREEIAEIAAFSRDDLEFDFLTDISSVDHMGEEPRFEVIYHLYATGRGQHLRLKLTVSEDDLSVPTVSTVWSTADWHEREIYDMMGLDFSGHPDLRRILMWDGYPYFPLRKDFPLAGKASDVPDVAFTHAAPLAGGPFVTAPSTATTKEREPRSRSLE